MATYILGSINYINYVSASGDNEISIAPIQNRPYRIYNSGTTSIDLIIKDSTTTSTITTLSDGNMLDLVYDTAWRTEELEQNTIFTGNLITSSTINTATITGGTWDSTKSGYLTQDVSINGTPDFIEIYVDSKLHVYYDEAIDLTIFAIKDGVQQRRLFMLGYVLGALDGGGNSLAWQPYY